MVIYKQLQNKSFIQQSLKKMTTRELAVKIGCSHGAVNYAIKRHGITVPKRTKYTLHVNKSDIGKRAYRKKYPKGRFGKNAGNWRGGKKILKTGYIYQYAPDHPNATKDGYVMEHRLVMEKKLGRILDRKEDVHHINGNKSDNRESNLVVATRKEHSNHHFSAVKEVERLKKILDKHKIGY